MAAIRSFFMSKTRRSENKINEEARDRFYREVGIHLAREGFSVLGQRDGQLPLEWSGAPLCRITAGGGAQSRRDDLEPESAGDAFQLATEIAHTTAEYMRLTMRRKNHVEGLLSAFGKKGVLTDSCRKER